MSLKLTTAVWRCAGQLTPRELITLLALADYADDEGVCWPGVATLARMTGASVRTIKYVLDDLRSPLRPGGSLLTVLGEGGGRGRPTIYLLHIPEPPPPQPPTKQLPRDLYPVAAHKVQTPPAFPPQMEHRLRSSWHDKAQGGAGKVAIPWTERLRYSPRGRNGERGDTKGAPFHEKSAIADGKGATLDANGAALDGKGATLTHEIPTSVINLKENLNEPSKDPSRQGAKSPIPLPKKVDYDPSLFQPCAYPGCLVMTTATYCGLHARGRLNRPRLLARQAGPRPDATIIPFYPRKPE